MLGKGKKDKKGGEGIWAWALVPCYDLAVAKPSWETRDQRHKL